MTRGRPRLLSTPTQVATCIEDDWYQHLKGEMLDEYRKQHPGAKMSDLLRSILGQAITEHTAGETGRQRKIDRRRRELRRLAAACAEAGDDKQLEKHARKLAALVG